MSLRDYMTHSGHKVKRFDVGGSADIDDEVNEPQGASRGTPRDTAEGSQSSQTPGPLKSKVSKESETIAHLANNPDQQAARDARLRAYYEKQLADAQRETEGFGSYTGIDTVLSKYGLSPTGTPNGQNIAAAKTLAQKQAQGATEGLAGLESTKANIATHQKFIGLLDAASKAEAAGDVQKAQMLRSQAAQLDPSRYGATAEARRLETQAVSNFGKQAADEGLARGTPAFNARVAELEKQDIARKERDFALRQQEVTERAALRRQNMQLTMARLDLALSKEANKPLNATEQKEVNRLTDESKIADRAAEEGVRLISTLKGAGIFDTGVGKFANPKYWFGAGKAAEIEAQISALAPKQRPPGAGATSDYDAKQYKEAVGGRLTPAGMKKAVEASIALNKHESDYSMFMATVKENRGSTTEAAKLWKAYSEANPIFHESGGTPIPDRYTFQQWVDKGMPDRKDTAKLPAGGAVPPAAGAAPPPAAAGNWSIKEKS